MHQNGEIVEELVDVVDGCDSSEHEKEVCERERERVSELKTCNNQEPIR
jgi:hypothetical protein